MCPAVTGPCTGAYPTRVRRHTELRPGGLEVEASASRVSLSTGTPPFVRPYIHATAGPTFVSALPSAHRRGPVRAYAGAEDRGETTRAAEARPRSAGVRCGAPVPRPGCLPHIANDVFKTVLPRQCPLGFGKGPRVSQGPPGCSERVGARGTPHFPRVKLLSGKQESSHPILNRDPGTLKWPADEFPLGIREPIALGSFAPQETHWPKGEAGGGRNDLFQSSVCVRVVSTCTIMTTVLPFFSQDKADLDRIGFCRSTLLLLNTPVAGSRIFPFFFSSPFPNEGRTRLH